MGVVVEQEGCLGLEVGYHTPVSWMELFRLFTLYIFIGALFEVTSKSRTERFPMIASLEEHNVVAKMRMKLLTSPGFSKNIQVGPSYILNKYNFKIFTMPNSTLCRYSYKSIVTSNLWYLRMNLWNILIAVIESKTFLCFKFNTLDICL